MARRNYKFTAKKQSKKGITATVLSGVSLASLILAVEQSFVKKGNGSVYLGSVGLLALFLSVSALIVAVNGYKEEDKFRFFLNLGTFLSLLSTVIWVGIYGYGFMV
ncbi:MAG: DUF6142 family protein [Lachnospiraceae bacterium]